MQKNLLFVFADQWRRHAMGCAGADPVETPHMDRFAAGGVYCRNAVSACPLCSPHRASLLTGLQPLTTGVFTNCKPGLAMKLREDVPSLGTILKENGYNTGYIGKWHLDEPEIDRTPEPESGARAWDAYTPPGAGRHGFDDWCSYGAWDAHLDPHYWTDSPAQIKPGKWSPEYETDRAIEFLQRQTPEKPFGLVLSWNPPHSPYDEVPEQYLARYREKEIPLRENVCFDSLHCHTGEPMDMTPADLLKKTRQYYAAVTGLDEQFGRLLDALDRLGLRENTCVVLSADHGDMMGSHGLMAKHVWYEESINIPFVAAGPGLLPGRCDTVIGGADILPTLLEWLELPVPESLEGTSRFAGIRQHTGADDSAAYICACPGSKAFLKMFREAGKDPKDFGWRALRTQRYTYVIDVGYEPDPVPRRYLYDLEKDPYQFAPRILNSAGEDPIAQNLEKRLLGCIRAYHDGFWMHVAAQESA
ncbi:MAG: sulfatase [Subdoligranulum sp.]|nr:sulfatase [Subdoligranulum sp.]